MYLNLSENLIDEYLNKYDLNIEQDRALLRKELESFSEIKISRCLNFTPRVIVLMNTLLTFEYFKTISFSNIDLTSYANTPWLLKTLIDKSKKQSLNIKYTTTRHSNSFVLFLQGLFGSTIEKITLHTAHNTTEKFNTYNLRELAICIRNLNAQDLELRNIFKNPEEFNIFIAQLQPKPEESFFSSLKNFINPLDQSHFEIPCTLRKLTLIQNKLPDGHTISKALAKIKNLMGLSLFGCSIHKGSLLTLAKELTICSLKEFGFSFTSPNNPINFGKKTNLIPLLNSLSELNLEHLTILGKLSEQNVLLQSVSNLKKLNIKELTLIRCNHPSVLTLNLLKKLKGSSIRTFRLIDEFSDPNTSSTSSMDFTIYQNPGFWPKLHLENTTSNSIPKSLPLYQSFASNSQRFNEGFFFSKYLKARNAPDKLYWEPFFTIFIHHFCTDKNYAPFILGLRCFLYINQDSDFKKHYNSQVKEFNHLLKASKKSPIKP